MGAASVAAENAGIRYPAAYPEVTATRTTEPTEPVAEPALSYSLESVLQNATSPNHAGIGESATEESIPLNSSLFDALGMELEPDDDYLHVQIQGATDERVGPSDNNELHLTKSDDAEGDDGLEDCFDDVSEADTQSVDESHFGDYVCEDCIFPREETEV